MKQQQLQNNRLTVLLIGILCLSQFVGTISAQKYFEATVMDKTVNPPTPGDDSARAIARQTDGKLIVAGKSIDAGRGKFSLVRYNTNGSLDTTFGTGGKVLTAISSDSYEARAVASLADGKILAAGNNSQGSHYAIIKYNSNGTIDTAFGSGGIVTADFGNNFYASYLHAITVQADGKIIIAGASDDGRAPLVRYNSNGTLDTTFGNGGIVAAFTGFEDDAKEVVMQGNKILVVGGNYFGNGRARLARLNSDGSPDYSFGNGGTVTLFTNSNE